MDGVTRAWQAVETGERNYLTLNSSVRRGTCSQVALADQSCRYGEAEAGGLQAFKASLDSVGDPVSTMERKEY